MKLISVTPRATEKAYALGANNVYVFNVPLVANKQEIAHAVETQFEVKVVRIKTLVQSGKAVRFSRGKNKYPGTTTRKDSKKAYVTLAAGDSIQVFAEPAAAEEEKK
ncbi:50S ribosomal protein L23 [bacterium]|nr:MAG: 50S ribosomal protein L23 [bacterium]